MPLALLSALLPLLFNIGGFIGGQKGGEALTSKLAGTGGKLLPLLGKLLSTQIPILGSVGGFAGGLAGGFAGEKLLELLSGGGGEETALPTSQGEEFSQLLTQLQNDTPEAKFQKAIQDGQLRGTLGQSLTQSGVDLNQLAQGVL